MGSDGVHEEPREAEVTHKFLVALLNHKEVRGLLSDEHFSVDGMQVAAWASMKSFRAKDELAVVFP